MRRQILEEHRKNCERQGKYVEAEIAKNRLDELRQHEENRRREAMRSRQIAERLGVEEAHMLEFQQFNALWDKRMAEFEQKSADLEEAMKERHGSELMEYIRTAQQEPLRKPKFSKELLNLRQIQQTLAKQKDYAGQCCCDNHEYASQPHFDLERLQRHTRSSSRRTILRHLSWRRCGTSIKYVGITRAVGA